jgi:hypothetical protein
MPGQHIGMTSKAAYLLYGKMPIIGWEIMYPRTETRIRTKPVLAGAECLKDLPLKHKQRAPLRVL